MSEQMHEQLIYEGRTHSMLTCPSLPENHPKIIKVSKRSDYDFEELLQLPDEEANLIINFFRYNPGCTRGYQGTWEIRDGKLFLVEIRGRLNLVGGPIFAEWFSGVICVPMGKALEYTRRPNDAVFQRELFIKIQSGRLIASKVIDNSALEIESAENSFVGGMYLDPSEEELFANKAH